MHAKMFSTVLPTVTVAALFGAVSCTVHKQEAPDITGPSEYATSITVTASPSTLVQNGNDYSLVRVKALDAYGQPKRLSLRVEIRVGGAPADFGTLSQRSVLTDATGSAEFVYVAPPAAALPPAEGTLVSIAVTPMDDLSGNALNEVTRETVIRLVPTGAVAPPAGLQPKFTAKDAKEGQPAIFDASESTSPSTTSIVNYEWDFGDGSSGSGMVASHVYKSGGVKSVKLTITDSGGRKASTIGSVTIERGNAPVAAFTMSPEQPAVNQTVIFNASTSVPDRIANSDFPALF